MALEKSTALSAISVTNCIIFSASCPTSALIMPCECSLFIVPSIDSTSAEHTSSLPWAIAWSSKLKPSRILPSAARAISLSAFCSYSIASAASIFTNWFSICSTRIARKLNCRHRESTVTGTFCGSVVANKNFTCSGGSSNVFNKALKLCPENMCTSSIK